LARELKTMFFPSIAMQELLEFEFHIRPGELNQQLCF
jgi:hypothetical protein